MNGLSGSTPRDARVSSRLGYAAAFGFVWGRHFGKRADHAQRADDDRRRATAYPEVDDCTSSSVRYRLSPVLVVVHSVLRASCSRAFPPSPQSFSLSRFFLLPISRRETRRALRRRPHSSLSLLPLSFFSSRNPASSYGGAVTMMSDGGERRRQRTRRARH
jgi:hypothetical protein